MTSAPQKRNGSQVEENQDSDLVQSPGSRPQEASFFAIYKKGQGYWTRMGTALGAAILITVTALFAFEQAKAANSRLAIGITAGVVIGGIMVSWLFMNKPRNVDFLIATDSEMKKVNWTSKGELFGSTRVVIFFMFLIALALFLIDVLVGLVFYYMGLLKINPLG